MGTAAPLKLPTSGMVCKARIGNDAFLWAQDGSITKLPSLTLLETGMSGDLAQKLDDGPPVDHKLKLVSLTHPELPPAPLPDWAGDAWMQPTGDTLFAEGRTTGNDIEVWRGGAWTKLDGASAVSCALIENVLEYEGAFWFTASLDLFRENAGRIEKVNVKDVPIGLMATNDGLSLLYASYLSPGELLQATLTKGTTGKSHTVGKTISLSPLPGYALTNGKSLAVFVEGGVYGSIHTRIEGKWSNPSRQALALTAIDGHDRVFYTTRDGLMVREPDGTSTTYLKSTSDLFQITNLRCAVLGQGFDKLPPASASQSGTLRVVVVGAENAPIAVCPRLQGYERCEDSTEKITGKLDESGAWSQRVPIGDYQATVQINGQWLVADPNGPTTKNWHCEIRDGEECTIELHR